MQYRHCLSGFKAQQVLGSITRVHAKVQLPCTGPEHVLQITPLPRCFRMNHAMQPTRFDNNDWSSMFTMLQLFRRYLMRSSSCTAGKVQLPLLYCRYLWYRSPCSWQPMEAEWSNRSAIVLNALHVLTTSLANKSTPACCHNVDKVIADCFS